MDWITQYVHCQDVVPVRRYSKLRSCFYASPYSCGPRLRNVGDVLFTYAIVLCEPCSTHTHTIPSCSIYRASPDSHIVITDFVYPRKIYDHNREDRFPLNRFSNRSSLGTIEAHCRA